VSCTSASHCLAVGHSVSSDFTRELPLVERWNGTHWTIQPAPDPVPGASFPLHGVSCTSATACTAVGEGSFSLHWDGTSWSTQTIPSLAGLSSTLSAIWCDAAGTCNAIGYHTLSKPGTVTQADRYTPMGGLRWDSPDAVLTP